MKFKARGTEAKFTPVSVTITAESQEELDRLYTFLNFGSVRECLGLESGFHCGLENLGAKYSVPLLREMHWVLRGQFGFNHQ